MAAIESAYNEPPDQSATLRRIPQTGDSFRPAKATIEDETLQPNRASSKSLLVSKTAVGPSNHVLDLLNFDQYLKAALQSPAASVNTISSASVTIASGGGGYTFTAASGTFDAIKGANQPRYVSIASAAEADNNGLKRVLDVSTDGSTLTVDTGTADTDTVDVTAVWYRNGSTRASYLVEKHFGDIDRRHHYRGMEIGSASIELVARQQIRVSFDWMGAQFGSGFGGDRSASAGDDSSELAPYSASRLTSSANVGTLYKDSAALTRCVQSITLNINNNLRDEGCIGETVRSAQHLNGQFQVTGSISGLFNESDLIELMEAHTAMDLMIPITDPDGNMWAIWLPEVTLDSGEVPTGGRNTSIVETYEFSTSLDSTFGYQMQIEPLTTLHLP